MVTIHQPSMEIFESCEWCWLHRLPFSNASISMGLRGPCLSERSPAAAVATAAAVDMLLLLQLGGRLTYFGPSGHESRNLIEYLQGQPGVVPIRPGYNPATWCGPAPRLAV